MSAIYYCLHNFHVMRYNCFLQDPSICHRFHSSMQLVIYLLSNGPRVFIFGNEILRLTLWHFC